MGGLADVIISYSMLVRNITLGSSTLMLIVLVLGGAAQVIFI